MAKTTSEQEFVGGGFDKRQAETQAAAFNRTKHHPSEISTLKWAAGLFAAAVIAGFGWLGSEIRETRASLSARIGGVEAHVDSLETRIDDLAINVVRVAATLEALSESQARIETLLDQRLPSRL